jgi:hypothetical protein
MQISIEQKNKAPMLLTVDQLAVVVYNLLDLSILRQVPDSNPCQRAIDLQPLNQDRLGDELEGGDFLHNTVEGG